MSIGRVASPNRVTRDGSSGLDARETLEERTNGKIEGPAAKSVVKPPRNPQVDQVAKLYEKQFLGEMVRAMRGTVDFGAEKPSMGESIYREQLDQQYTESWGENGGIGLSDLIYNQIMERYFNGADGQAVRAKENGASTIPLTDREVSKVMHLKTAEAPGQVPLRVELKKTADGAPAKVLAPWSGEVVSNSRLEGGKTALMIKHGPSLKSTLIFQGVAAASAQPGAKIEKGAAVGTLSPEIHSFLWNINKSSSAPAKAEAPQPDLDGSRG